MLGFQDTTRDAVQHGKSGTIGAGHHLLQPILKMVDEALKALDSEFNALYAEMGRDSIPSGKTAMYTVANGSLYHP